MQTNPTPSCPLPAPVAGYFASYNSAPETLAHWFSEDAIVIDEHQAHRGRDAIASWNAAANAKYETSTEVLAAESDATRTTVRARVSGNFPGGRVELRFRFTLRGERIARLEIAP